MVSIDVDVTDDVGEFLNEADVSVTVIGPQLNRTQQLLRHSAPGRYHTELQAGQSGAYHLEFAVRQDSRVLYRQSRGITVGYSDELRIRPTNQVLLQTVAEYSGGRFDLDPAAIFADDHRRAVRPTELWPLLLVTAIIMLVFDVALRRIDLSVYQPFARWIQR